VDFDLNDLQREIRDTARALLDRRVTSDRLRAAAEARATESDLWEEFCAFGWPGVAVAEGYGGAGLGLVELCVLVEQQGAALAPTPLLPTTCAALAIETAGSDDQRERWLARLARGEVLGAIGATSGDEVAGLAAGAPGADVVVLFDGDCGFLIEGPVGNAAPLATVDPLRSYGLVAADCEPLPGDTALARAKASVAVAAELTGICQRALDVTVTYVKERRQFGVPVGSFQAVAHRCAEMLLHTESARSATYHGAWAADAAEPGVIEAAALAKYAASEAAVEVTTSAIQAHGGVGFTWEADVHWWYKRAQLSARLLGGADEHVERLGALPAAAETTESPPTSAVSSR
jgi:alkylation response protein AidB-like acyl-CoA dehydrogenase